MENKNEELIRKKDALDALNEQIEQCNKALGSFDISPKDEYAIKVERASLKAYKEQLENLPPAQTEPLTDREQRIFLAAMSREKEVCKEVDYQFSDVREPYEDTLVSVCKKIERKVKAALWTN